jgi:hypothetical protein
MFSGNMPTTRSEKTPCAWGGIDAGAGSFGGEDHLADDLARGQLQLAAGLAPIAQRHAKGAGKGKAADNQQHQTGEIAIGGAIEEQPAETGSDGGEQQRDDAHLQQADVDVAERADDRQLALVEPTKHTAGDQPGKDCHRVEQ